MIRVDHRPAQDALQQLRVGVLIFAFESGACYVTGTVSGASAAVVGKA